VKRLIPAVLAGCSIACLAAETLGEYPLTGVIPWLACLIVPALIGTAMTAIAARFRGALWVATGPLSAACLAWGVSISTSWGIDPVPAAAWAEMAIGLTWPLAWALLVVRKRPARFDDPSPSTTSDTQRTASSEMRPS
jgi:hypothetical protein